MVTPPVAMQYGTAGRIGKLVEGNVIYNCPYAGTSVVGVKVILYCAYRLAFKGNANMLVIVSLFGIIIDVKV